MSPGLGISLALAVFVDKGRLSFQKLQSIIKPCPALQNMHNARHVSRTSLCQYNCITVERLMVRMKNFSMLQFVKSSSTLTFRLTLSLIVTPIAIVFLFFP